MACPKQSCGNPDKNLHKEKQPTMGKRLTLSLKLQDHNKQTQTNRSTSLSTPQVFDNISDFVDKTQRKPHFSKSHDLSGRCYTVGSLVSS